jgi:threonine dehydrogenase-like Zn-dependent dehydrogenase
MRAVVFRGPGRKAWEEVPDPEITDEGDVIVRVETATICGTDLHILLGGGGWILFTRAADTGALKVALSRCGE